MFRRTSSTPSVRTDSDTVRISVRICGSRQIERLTTHGALPQAPDLLAVYDVEVSAGSQCWQTVRSYSTFAALAETLRKRRPAVANAFASEFQPHRGRKLARQDHVADTGADAVEERLRKLGVWLQLVTESLQCCEFRLLSFLLPAYVAHRMFAGDVDLGDLQESR